MADVPRNCENYGLAVELDIRALRLDPETGLVAIDDLHFNAARRIFTGQAFRNRFAEQRAIRGLHQIGYFATG